MVSSTTLACTYKFKIVINTKTWMILYNKTKLIYLHACQYIYLFHFSNDIKPNIYI